MEVEDCANRILMFSKNQLSLGEGNVTIKIPAGQHTVSLDDVSENIETWKKMVSTLKSKSKYLGINEMDLVEHIKRIQKI